MSDRRGLVLGIVFFAASGILAATGLDLLTFALPMSSRTGMSGTWDPRKLSWLGVLSLIASFVHGFNAQRFLQTSSPQRIVSQRWSVAMTLLTWCVVMIGFLVYYPIPYFNHHIDKFTLFLGVMLVWGIWLCVHPDSLGWMLESRPAGWMRIVAINSLVFLVVAEIILRLADPFLARSGLFSAAGDTPGGGIPYQAVSGSIKRTNSMGFRDRERTMTRTSEALRVVALGDSFTWGSGVSYDDTFVKLIERGLDQIVPGAEVINLGMIGYQPEDYLSLLKSHGLSYHPDLILVNFFVGNDFMPAQGVSTTVAGLRHRVHVDGNWFHDHLSWDHWYLSHDLAYAGLVGKARIRRALGQPDLGMFDVPADGHSPDNAEPKFSGWSPQYVRMIMGMSDQYLTRDTPAFLSRWYETKEILEQLDTLLQNRRIPWVLILLPAEEQVDHGLQRLYMEMRGGEQDQYDFDKPQRVLSEWAGTRGVKVIDLASAFRANVRSERLYVDNDIHWNRRGNAVAARVIMDEFPRELIQKKTVARN
ncbi:MAG TPA: SGNH/GDSL hydrolase family protein [Nitrospira sp.]